MNRHLRRSLISLSVLASLSAACTSSGTSGGTDMATPAVDMATQSGDLTTGPAADLSTNFPPLVGSIDPGRARTSGGVTVTVSGSGFVDGAKLALSFGGAPATNVKFVSSSTVTATLPARAGTLGAVTVDFTNGNGTVVSNTDLFNYVLDMVSFAAPTSQTTGAASGPRGIVVADIDGDKLTDIATANADNNTVTFFKGKGDGTLGSGVAMPVGGYPFMLARGDVNGDGRVDLLTPNQVGNSLNILYQKADGTFDNQSYAVACGGAQAAAVADVDGDQDNDVVLACYKDGNVKVLLNKGNNMFDVKTVSYGLKPYSLTLADANGDNSPDILTANSDTANVSVLLNDGSGGFTLSKSYAAGTGPFYVEMVDLNRDGYPELAVANSADAVNILPGLPDRTFDKPVAITVAGRPEVLLTTDLDGDLNPDLIIPSLNSGAVTVLLGKGDRTFNAPIALRAGTKPNALGVGVMDASGLPTLAVTNYGDSTISLFKNTSK